MEEIVLKAQPRNIIGKQVRQLRRQGLMPAVIYGHKIEPIAISLNLHETSKILSKVSSSQLVTVDVEGGARHTVLVREKQRNPITSILLHLDFLAISMTEKLKLNVNLHFEGEAPAVKAYGGVLVTSRETLEIESLPGNLPSTLAVDLSGLTNIGSAVHVRDIQMPEGVVALDDPEEIVVLVTPPATDVEDTESGFAEPEVIEKGKKEEENF
jgi:large subunit ribosomal protein L25